MSCLLWLRRVETKRVAIADVIRTEIAKGLDKWDDDQLQCMKLAVKLLEE